MKEGMSIYAQCVKREKEGGTAHTVFIFSIDGVFEEGMEGFCKNGCGKACGLVRITKVLKPQTEERKIMEGQVQITPIKEGTRPNEQANHLQQPLQLSRTI